MNMIASIPIRYPINLHRSHFYVFTLFISRLPFFNKNETKSKFFSTDNVTVNDAILDGKAGNWRHGYSSISSKV